MRLGFFMMPVHPPARSFTETLAEDTEKSLLADRLGFSELWLGEHFSATSEPIPSPMMFMAGLVPRTKNLQFGTGVIYLPNHDPVVVAAEAAQFDHMSRGSFLLGVGPGGLVSDFELFRHTDVDRAQPQGRGIGPHHAADLVAGSAIQHRRRVLECAAERHDRPRSRHRLHAEAVPERRPADFAVARQSAFVVGAHGGAARLGHSFGQYRPDLFGRVALGDLQQGVRRSRQTRLGRQWRVARNVMVAPTDAEAYDRVFGEHAAHHYLFDIRPHGTRAASEYWSS